MDQRISGKKLHKDLIWNYGSLAIMSISGLLLNCLIALFYNASIVGIFNSTYAWYCILSQITVLGTHMSVLRLIPEYKEDIEICKQILTSALAVSMICSIICVVLMELFLPCILIDSPLLLKSMQFAISGLFFFSINKVLLNYLNGFLYMKSYAVFQSLRYVFMIGIVFFMGIMKIDGEYLSACYFLSELMLFVLMFFYLYCSRLLGRRIKLKYIIEHIRFGLSILPANMVVELNTKVDIVCLGFIMQDDYWIGIYSFAVIFTEGFYQLYIVIRKFYNPKLTESYFGGDFISEVAEMKNTLKRYLRILSPLILSLIILGYYIICCIINHKEYSIGIEFLMIIGISIAINGREIVFGNIFSQTGFPLYESFINLITVITNFILNIVFILHWGVHGAALATAISYMVYGIGITYGTKKRLKIQI